MRARFAEGGATLGRGRRRQDWFSGGAAAIFLHPAPADSRARHAKIGAIHKVSLQNVWVLRTSVF